jgi:hypothetical protein
MSGPAAPTLSSFDWGLGDVDSAFALYSFPHSPFPHSLEVK